VVFGNRVEIFEKIKQSPFMPITTTKPYANARDAAVKEILQTKGASLKTFKDQVIFERSERVKEDGKA
jgi:deoxyribodipyrimidine photo-lyase